MADDRNEIRHVNWAELFTFTQIFKGFRLAIAPGKMALAFVAVALTWLAAMGLQSVWKLDATHGYVMPGEIAQRTLAGDRAGGRLDETRTSWLEARAGAAARLAGSAQRDFVGGFEARADMSYGGHFRTHYRKLVAEEKFEPGKPLEGDAVKSVSQALAAAQKEIDAVHDKLDRVIAKAYSAAKDQARDGKDPADDKKGLSDSEKKTVLAQVAKDHAKAIKALADQRAHVEAQMDAIRGQGVFTALAEYEWDCLYKGIVAVTNGNIFTGLPLAGPADAADRGFLAWVLLALGGLAWLLSEHIVFGLILLVVTLAIWAVLGGAIHRMAALQAARDEKISLKQAVQFALSKWLSFFTAPLIPLAVVFVFGALIVLGGVVGNLWGFGAVLMGVLLLLAIVMGLVIAFITVGLVAGCGLMYPTIAVEGSDSFDAISRSFAYVYAKPWRAALYAVVALVYGVVCYLFVRLFAWIALASTQAFLRWGCWQGGEAAGVSDKVAAMWPAPTFSQLLPSISWSHLSGWEAVGAGFMWLWIAVIVGFSTAFLLSYAASANTVIYLLLRRKVDATDLDDVYVQEQQDQPLVEQPTTTPATTEKSTESTTTEKSDDAEKKE